MNITDLFRDLLGSGIETLDDARQIAVERQLSEIRAMRVAELVALTAGAIHESLEDLLYELAEEWADRCRADGFDALAADREELRDE